MEETRAAVQVTVKQLSTSCTSSRSGAIRRFKAQAERAIATSKQSDRLCPVLGLYNKNGRDSLVTQRYECSIRDKLSAAPGEHHPSYIPERCLVPFDEPMCTL